jgi:hypothetical protein
MWDTCAGNSPVMLRKDVFGSIVERWLNISLACALPVLCTQTGLHSVSLAAFVCEISGLKGFEVDLVVVWGEPHGNV